MTSTWIRRAVAAAALVVAGCGGGGGGGGLPPGTPDSVDLTVDADALAASVEIVDRFFDETDCAWVEGAIGGTGTRRLLRFDTVIPNVGELDLVVGNPEDPMPPLVAGDFEYSPCHDHHHFSGFAEYELRDATGTPVAFGHKQAFCLLDSVPYLPGRPRTGFDCEFQGISSGWADIYDRTLDGQWVDVTGVPAGTYTLVVTVNAAGKIVEAVDDAPNVATVEVVLPPP